MTFFRTSDAGSFYEEVLQFAALGCRADRALFVGRGLPSGTADRSLTRVYPLPGSAEEAQLWQHVAGHVWESAFQETPLELPRDLRNALDIGSSLAAPVHGAAQGEILGAIATFGSLSSPPLDSEDAEMLSALAGELAAVFEETVADWSEPSRLGRVSRILGSMGVLRSVYDLCGALDTATSLATRMCLAEAAAIRMLNDRTGELELVASSGNERFLSAWPIVAAGRCRVAGAASPSDRLAWRGDDSPSATCPVLRSNRGATIVCARIALASGVQGVLELWRPSISLPSSAGARLVRAVTAIAESGFERARMYAPVCRVPVLDAFMDRAYVATRTSGEAGRAATELLIALRQVLAFDVAALVEQSDDPAVPPALVATVVSASRAATDAEPVGFMETRFPEPPPTLVPGGAAAETWAREVMRRIETPGARPGAVSFHFASTPWPVALLLSLISGDRVVGLVILGKVGSERFSPGDRSFLRTVQPILGVLWESFACRVRLASRTGMDGAVERIATLEQLAASTAHEIRNPLSVIRGYLQVIQSDPSTTDETRRRIERLFHQLDQINGVVSGLVHFAKPVPLDLSVISLPGMLEEVLETLEPHALSAGVEIVRSYSEDVPEIMADAAKLQQVFLNLGRNGMEAMTPQGGKLFVSTRVTPDRGAVEVEFRDTGCGMTAEVMSQIFRPFFTTKKHGVGLGLSISMHIVRQHGGTIRVESAPGAGASFIVVLPTH